MSQVRIIAGTHRSRRIEVQDAKGLRPTTDRVRETLFNWLAHDIYGKNVLDLFAGSGALGFEAASRGALHVDMVDNAEKVVKQLLVNKKALQFENINIQRTFAKQFINKNEKKYDLIFLDPPFDNDDLNTISAIINDCAGPDALLYREFRKNQVINDMNPEFWTLHKQKTAGQVCFELWKKEDTLSHE
ncbi:16S rRNA (guanine(966)-N(2))-methyltransferase RsmD [Marinicella rhabdoformis]|uniref:16S rRNA (guanine(966)-N(2))-methyltransferase RsmD n=1 Tax=Marinicella rhabdoformis TaxID=2580566 RepID=UPI0012AED2D2